jgi:hypothetical protein
LALAQAQWQQQIFKLRDIGGYQYQALVGIALL